MGRAIKVGGASLSGMASVKSNTCTRAVKVINGELVPSHGTVMVPGWYSGTPCLGSIVASIVSIL
jgi:hypothetical protein